MLIYMAVQALYGMNGILFSVKLAWKYWWGKVAVRKTLQQADLTRLSLLITNMRGFLLNFFIGNSIWNIFLSGCVDPPKL